MLSYGNVTQPWRPADFLANSRESHAAFVEQLFHAFVKQPIRAYGASTKDRLVESFVQCNFSIRHLMVEIVATSALATEPDATQAAVHY